MKAFNNKQVTSGQALGPIAGPNKLTRYAFYALVFAFPWESLDIGLGENLSLAKLFGFLLFGAGLLQPKICFRFPPNAFWFFFLYLFLFGMRAFLADSSFDNFSVTREILRRGFQIGQMLVLFWISYNVMHDERVVKGFLFAFICACLSLPIGSLFMEDVSRGIRSGDIDEERLVTLGVDPNTTGATFALGIISLLGLAYGRQESNLKIRLFAWVPFLVLAGFLIRTGSRGAMLSLVIGIAFFLVKRGNIRTKIGLGLIVFLGVGTLTGITLTSDMVKRFENAIAEGHTSGRDIIFSEASGMVNEKPMIGWGPVRFLYELGNRVGRYGQVRDPHNLYLKVLLEVGIVGALPFFGGLGFCFWAAWKGRNGLQGSLPVSILITLLMINMSITWDGRKIFWIILAYALVSSSHIYSRRSTMVDSYSGQRNGGGINKSSKKSGTPIMVGKIN